MAVAQVWKSSKFTIERKSGQDAGHSHLSIVRAVYGRGICTARFQPNALRNTFEAEEGGDPHALPNPRSPYSGPDGGPLHGFCWTWTDRQPLCPVPGQKAFGWLRPGAEHVCCNCSDD